MKKAFLFCCAFLLWAAQLVAAPARVRVVSERGVPFQLVFDGQAITRGMSREVALNGVLAGTHWAEFRIPARRGLIKYRTRVYLQPGYESNYLLIARPGFAPVLRKVSAVPLRRRPGYNQGYDDNYGPARGQNGRNDGYDDDRRDDRRPDYKPSDRDSQDNQNDRDEQNDRNDRNNYPDSRGNGRYDDRSGNAGRYRSVLSAGEVDALMRSVDSKSFDSGKLSVAKDGLSQSAIRVDDLKRLLGRFDFESQRLDLAKYAASRVADPQNFYQVYDLFNYDSNVKELQQYNAQLNAQPTQRPDDYRPGTVANPDYNGRYRSVMSVHDAEDLRAAAHRKSFDKDKLALMQEGLARVAIRTADLLPLLREFSFDDQRLQLAKFAYGRVADPQNFYQAYELFTFNATADALRNYVAQQPRR